MPLLSCSVYYGRNLNGPQQAHVVAFVPWLVEILRESHGGLWKWGEACGWLSWGTGPLLSLLRGTPSVHPFIILLPQTEPLLHCGLPWWAEISLQRGLSVEATSSLGEGVHTELKISSLGPYLLQGSDRERYD